MQKYTLFLDNEPYSLDLLLDAKPVGRSERSTGWGSGDKKIPTSLNYLNYSIFYQYLSTCSSAQLKKLASSFKDIFQFCTTSIPISEHHNAGKTASIQDLTKSYTAFSEDYLRQHFCELLPSTTVQKTTLTASAQEIAQDQKSAHYRQYREHFQIRYFEPSFLTHKFEIQLEPVSSDLKAVSLSKVKQQEKQLLSYIDNKMFEKIDNLLKQLNAYTPIHKSLSLSLNGHNFGSHANYELRMNEAEIHSQLIDFLKNIQPYVKKILDAIPLDKLKNVSYGEFKGVFSKEENMDKNKSYMYIVRDNRGETGFLGLTLTPYKSTREYASQYSLKPVQSISAALIFHTPNYKECGIGELRNKGLYTAVEAVECSQIFRMKDTVFSDNKIQAFAAALQKAHLEEYMSNLKTPSVSETSSDSEPAVAPVAKKRHKI